MSQPISPRSHEWLTAAPSRLFKDRTLITRDNDGDSGTTAEIVSGTDEISFTRALLSEASQRAQEQGFTARFE